MRAAARFCLLASLALVLVWCCGFDTTLREYLSARFWQPFAKHAANFERPNVRRVSAPFAGMTAEAGERPLAKLRAAYREIAEPQTDVDAAAYAEQVAAARQDASLTRREREEVDLIDAKIDLRAGGRLADVPVFARRRDAHTTGSRAALRQMRLWLSDRG